MELFDRHGKGDDWATTWLFVRDKLRTKSLESRKLLTYFRDSGKVILEETGNNLRISIPQFRKRQAKLKFKTPSRLPQDSLKTPQEGEREREREREGEREYTPPTPSPNESKKKDIGSLLRLWNDEAPEGIERAIALSGKRAKAASARLSERPLNEWAEIILRIRASKFCRGENERGWKANIDWLLRPDTATKVLEGKYDDRKPGPINGGRIVGDSLPVPGKYAHLSQGGIDGPDN